MKENYDSLQNYYTQLGGYSLAHNKVYGSNISQGVILLATTDLVFQILKHLSQFWEWVYNNFY